MNTTEFLHPKRARVLLAACAVAGGLAAANPAAAITITTLGTIDSGTDTSGVFGAPGGNLAGKNYSLALTFDGLGSFTFLSSSAFNTSGPITGRLTATVGGTTFSAPFVNSFGAFIEETPNEITGFNTGDNNAGESLYGNNTFETLADVFPVGPWEDVAYTAGPDDVPLEAGLVSFSVGGPLGTATFTATPAEVVFAVPEPASLSLAVAGLCVAGMARRRRRV